MEVAGGDEEDKGNSTSEEVVCAEGKGEGCGEVADCEEDCSVGDEVDAVEFVVDSTAEVTLEPWAVELVYSGVQASEELDPVGEVYPGKHGSQSV